MRAPRWARATAWLGAIALLALHLDAWRPQRNVTYLGVVPEELAWRLGWMVLATAYLVFFCRCVWRDGEDAS